MRRLLLIILLSALPLPVLAAQELDFVTAYVRAMSTTEDIRLDALAEAETGTNQDKMASCIHNSTLQQLEFSGDANMIATFKLTGTSKDTPNLLLNYYVKKGELYSKIEKICQVFLEGPKPGVDYGRAATELPKLRAQMDYLDKNLLTMAVLVFSTLIRETPDRQGHMSRLIITHKDRDELVNEIDARFQNLDAKDANYTVSSAYILKYYLTKKGYKLADDPE